CAIDSSRAVPSSGWQGLVVINGNNVTVRNLRLRDSAGAAITFPATSVQRNIVIENNDIADWAKAIINANRVQHIVIRGNVARNGNWCDLHKYPGCTGEWWAAGIYINNSSPAHALLENNVVTGNYGEGLSCLRSSHVIIRGNRVGNLRSALYYLDNCSDSVVEKNIGWSDPTKKWHWRGTGMDGITIAVEDYNDSTARGSMNNIIRNNMIAAMGACIRVDMDSRAREQGRQVGAKIYGNTCMGIPGNGFLNFLSDRNVRMLEVRNNIFHSSPSSQDPCRNNAPNSVSMSANLWSKTPANGSCRGKGDVVGDPRVQGSGWAAKSFDNPPKASDFQLRSDSPARSAGVALTSKLGHADQLLASAFVRSPCAIFDTSDLSHDFNCTRRSAKPNLGALEDGGATRPQAPVLAY
ncbi:MAG: right-handed parallel beta-helix repeat-containing protein, partial [Pseudomonadales bacterium]